MTPTLLLLVAAGCLLVVVVAAAVLRGRDGRDDVERFHQARTLTTTWAEQHRAEHDPAAHLPRQPYPDSADEAAPASAEDRRR